MLKELEIGGFKSFAKKAVLEFRTPISAIVGPNGSGKSNVAESLRFVLGEQSIKSMRGKKGEDLIFNGSTGAPRANRASVKIVFDNKGKTFDVDYEEISIERIVHRDGTNEYSINGSLVRLKDVLELLSRANIGASGHHIISQGEADRILSVSPKERKSMIEDALGLKIYQYKKEESLRKLDKTEENIKQIEGLRREIAPHLKFLKRQVEKLEKLESMKAGLISLYHDYFKRESLYLKYAKEKIEAEVRGPREELRILENELGQAKAVLEADKNADSIDVLASLNRALEEKRVNTSALGREAGRIDGEISSLEKNLKRQKEYLSRQEATSISMSEIRLLDQKIKDVSHESEQQNDVSVLRKLIRDICDMFGDLIKKSSGESVEDNEMIKSLETEIASLVIEKEEIGAKLTRSRHEEEEAMSFYNSKRDEIEKEKDTFKDAEKNIYKIMARQNELLGIVNALRHSEDRLVMEKSEYESELNEALVLIGPEAIRFDDVSISENGKTLSDMEVAFEDRHRQETRKKDIERIKIRLEDQGISGSDDILKEFKETAERDEFLERELTDLFSSASSLKQLILELELKLNEEFQTGIFKINSEFKKFFGMMFGGGEAGLQVITQPKRKKKDIDLDMDISTEEVEEEKEETEDGIEVNVNLPHKKIKGLMMLSGGERALTSIALLFAISQVNPPPFIVLDETDAALDEANSRKYADMVKALSAHSQIILITHNRETMNAAGVLYGVTMGGDGISKILSVSFDEATNFAK